MTMLARHNPQDAYRRVDFDARVTGADPMQLVALCYEHLIAALGTALFAHERADNAAKSTALTRGVSALTALLLPAGPLVSVLVGNGQPSMVQRTLIRPPMSRVGPLTAEERRSLIEADKANRVKYEMFSYPNANHGFHNDSTPRYDEAAAKVAWSRTIAFFDKNLRG